jgi:phosphoglycolate phosphatase-like HAD superfamily hydrolase
LKRSTGYRYYLFDYDGTICHSQPAISYSLRAMFSEKGMEPPTDTASKAAIGSGKGLAGVISLLLPPGYSAEATEMQEMITMYRRNYIAEGARYVTFFDGVEAVFQSLRSTGAKVIIASNKNYKAIYESLVAHQLLDLVDLVIGEGVLPTTKWKMKPDTAIYDSLITSKFPDISKHKSLMIGDTPVDIQFAHNCRLDACWAAFGYGQSEDILPLAPLHTVNSLEEIIDLKPGKK